MWRALDPKPMVLGPVPPPMSERGREVDREFTNVGPGPDEVALSDLADGVAFLVVFLQRDHYCANCRQQVQAVKARYEEFRERDAEVVSVVPEPEHRVAAWQDRFTLPFPLLSDPEASVGGAFDQPVRFGFLGAWSDFLGRMPEVVLLDAREGTLQPAWSHTGGSAADRPPVEDVIAALDEHREGAPAEGGEGG